MTAVIDETFRQCVEGKDPRQARISVYERIRDIPYAVIPELNSVGRYQEILTLAKGSCTPKHFLLGNMYQRLGLMVLFAVYPFRWEEFEVDYTPQLKKLSRQLPTSYHLACRAEIDGELVLVDATIDLAMERLGIPVNKNWDGVSDTRLPIKPCGAEELYHPDEAYLMQAQYDDKALVFYEKLNQWLEELRGLWH